MRPSCGGDGWDCFMPVQSIKMHFHFMGTLIYLSMFFLNMSLDIILPRESKSLMSCRLPVDGLQSMLNFQPWVMAKANLISI